MGEEWPTSKVRGWEPTSMWIERGQWEGEGEAPDSGTLPLKKIPRKSPARTVASLSNDLDRQRVS